MLQGQWLVAKYSAATSLFTDWFPRQRMNAIITYELVASVGATSLAVEVYHKNEDQVGNGDVITGLSWTTSNGMTYALVTGLKEMVRLKVSLSSEAESSEAAFFRILVPTWYDSPNS